MKNVLKITAIASCLASLYQANTDAVEEQQWKGRTRQVYHRMQQENLQPYGRTEGPSYNKKYRKQEGKALKAGEQNPFALYFLNEKIKEDFEDIMDDKKSPQHSKLTRLIEDIKLDPWELKGEGKPEKLKGAYKGFEGCYSRRIDHCNRLVYKVEDRSIRILACQGHYK